jgi:replication factor C small subunit|tara:strand:+ start:374 stop:1297 length:924 start_codon:yes stop_codon:yes gene_type:complete
MKDNTLFVEHYRPSTLKGYVGNEQIKNTIQRYLNQDDIQNFCFYGPSGTGKTTLAKIIIKNLNCDYLYINASDERGIDTIREKVTGFASTASFKSLKVIILDEADFLTINAQASLRNVIETFSRTTRFILTCNYIERIIDPIQSRCQVLKVIPPSKKEIAQHLVGILNQENVEYQLEDLANVVTQFYPDLRKMLNTIQLSIVDNKLKVDKTVVVSSSYMNSILKELKQPKPSWTQLRQIILDSGVKDFEETYRFLFEHISKYAPGREGTVSVILNEHLYQANFRIDKEINIASCLSKIVDAIKPQVI